MSRTRSEAIADAIAKRIMANTRTRFSSLHSEVLTEINMATPTSSNGINTQQSYTGDCAAKEVSNSGGAVTVSEQFTESLAKAADNGGPRESVGQFPLSRRTPAAPAPQEIENNEGVGA